MTAVYSLSAYSIDNFTNGVRGVSVNISKAENGYIFSLQGEKENPAPKNKNEFFDRWERFSATFVYSTLEDGLKEVDGFFKLIEKMLAKKTK